MNEAAGSDLRRASRGWGVSFGVAMIGIVMLAIGYGGTLEVRRGGDPLDALDSWGLGALLVVWALLYLVRLIFWRRVSVRRQAQVRMLFAGLLAGEVLVFLAATWFQMQCFGDLHVRGHTGMPIAAMVVAGLCQIATLTWLARYRSE